MSKQASPALIGSFVLGGAALLVVFVLIIAGNSFFKEERQYVIYFEGSIYGLKIGSNVMFRGVPIGYVSDIDVLADFRDMEFIVPVTITILADTISAIEPDRGLRPQEDEDIDRLIEMGLRATLASESLITGQLYIEMDFHPETKAIFRGMNNDMAEIPSIPSGIQEVIKSAQTFISDIQQNLDIPKVMADVTSLIEGMEQFVNANDTQSLTAEINTTLASVRQTLDTVNTVAANLDNDIDPAIVAFVETLNRAETVLELAEMQLRDDSDIAYRLGTTLKEVEAAARAIRVLAEELDQSPEAIIQGKKQ